MQIVVANNYDELSAIASQLLQDEICNNPACVLGLATGSTPLGTYRALVDQYKKSKVDFSSVTSFNLDEYCGLSCTSPNSYRTYMNEHLFDCVNINIDCTYLPNGNASNLKEECMRYERQIEEAGGIDIQLLGIGLNGHIGFNEPADFFSVATHVVELADSTIKSNSRNFTSQNDVPTKAITMGVGTIMKARKIVLLANGNDKADIVRRALFGDVVPSVPASVLQLHRDVTVVLDTQAASKLSQHD